MLFMKLHKAQICISFCLNLNKLLFCQETEMMCSSLSFKFRLVTLAKKKIQSQNNCMKKQLLFYFSPLIEPISSRSREEREGGERKKKRLKLKCGKVEINSAVVQMLQMQNK